MNNEMNHTLELIISWGGNPQSTEMFDKAASLRIGDEEGSAFALPREIANPFTLVEASDGEWVVRAPVFADIRVGLGDQVAPAPTQDEVGTRHVKLSPGMRVLVSVGAFEFTLQLTEAAEEVAAPMAIEWRVLSWIGASAVVHGIFLAVFLLMPPEAGALTNDLNAQALSYIQATMNADESWLEEEDPQGTEPGEMSEEGQPSEGEQGQAGHIDETRNTGGGIQVRGESDDRRVPLTAEDVRNQNVLGAIAALAGTLSDVSNIYGAENAMGFATEDAYGVDGPPGFSRGTGGLDMIGTGRGGCPPGATNCARGTTGVGNLTTIGGRGTCTRSQFDRFESELGRGRAIENCGGTFRSGTPIGNPDRTAGVPEVRPGGDVAITGGLSRETIRRRIRQNIAQMRHCYEQALTSRPDLAGRVSVQFIISPTGAVTTSQVRSSNLGNASVESCVAQAVRRTPFPASEGVTSVTYPFMFQTPN